MNEVFEKLPAIESKDLHQGCASCSTAALIAPMNMIIAVGFGSAIVTKNNKLIYDENNLGDDGSYWTVQDAEKLAIESPDADWRIQKNGPLHGETFQRQGVNNWVCVESNQGFA